MTIQRGKFMAGLVIACSLMAASAAKAVPALQLDIIGGTYDAATQTVVSSGPSFTLLALATPTGNTSASAILADTYFISMALLPPASQSAGFDAGSFTVDGSSIQATDAGLTYGTPPLDAAHNKDLPSHGIFPTYHHEISFQFDASDTTTTYNSQDDTGGVLFDENGTGSFFAKLEINVGGLIGQTLHFDLYNTKVKNNGTISVDDFAPFSHDAQSGLSVVEGDVDVPEPAAGLILIGGIAVMGILRRRSAHNS